MLLPAISESGPPGLSQLYRIAHEVVLNFCVYRSWGFASGGQDWPDWSARYSSVIIYSTQSQRYHKSGLNALLPLDDDKSEPTIVILDLSLQKSSVNFDVFVQTQTILANKHAGHISFLTFFRVSRYLSLDRIQELNELTRCIFEQLWDFDGKRLIVFPHTNTTLIDTKSLHLFLIADLILLLLQSLFHTH